MFAQIIRGKVTDPAAIRPVVERWMREIGPSATGWLGSTSGITEDGQLFVLVRFDSAESAKANSHRAEQGRWWAEMEKLLDGEATFQDSTDVMVETVGDPDAAGFVQVISGQSSDPDRSQELGTKNLPAQRSLRPDILGSVGVRHEGGRYTMVIYFESEQAAREGERKPPPPDIEADMKEMMSLMVGAPEFLDLKSPWLDSPAR